MEYISSPNEIYRAFAGQNHRFDSILQYVHLSIDFFHENQQNLLSLRYFSSYCNRLCLYNICPSISLIRFPRLHSLTIIEPTESQINSIRSSALPMLKYLVAPPTSMICDCLFGNEKQRWQYLHSCSFLFSPLPNLKNSWKPNYNLLKLSGITCSRIKLSQLLLLVPSLQYLHFEFLFDDSTWKLPLNVNHLISLRIRFPILNYNDLSALLGSNLRYLYLDISSIDDPIDFVHIGSLIESNSSKLKQFNCDYQGNDLNMEEIRIAHTIFKNIISLESDVDEPIRLICKNIEHSKKKKRSK
ncbi:hypothetical protein I4U23_027859 [Adineta vaga]|nr:hypothetical protein I4U23_027859 [Adineta vaga]